jgi:ATP-dependent Clp protease ATP-binding subunit ClpA
MSGFKSFWKKLAESQGPPVIESFGTFTPRAMQVMQLARLEASHLGHNFVGTEHVLLGLLAFGRGVAVNALHHFGIDPETVRTEVKNYVGFDPTRQNLAGAPPYTPRTKKALALALKEAKALNHTYVGTEHILLGLLREGTGVAGQILRKLGMDLEKTRQEIIKELDPTFVSTADTPGGSPSTTNPGQPNFTSPSVGESVDTSKWYDVHCTDWSQGVTVYRNIRFKSLKQLFQRSQYDMLSGYVELEQVNGKSVFVSRGSIILFIESGATPGSEGDASKKE